MGGEPGRADPGRFRLPPPSVGGSHPARLSRTHALSARAKGGAGPGAQTPAQPQRARRQGAGHWRVAGGGARALRRRLLLRPGRGLCMRVARQTAERCGRGGVWRCPDAGRGLTRSGSSGSALSEEPLVPGCGSWRCLQLLQRDERDVKSGGLLLG